MAYYEGETLKQKIQKGALEIREALDIILQISEGLYAAHQKGIIHRDIKPANILITREGIVKILDFGLAQTSGKEHLTLLGSTVGTAAYMSVEQAKGETVDERSDIWSLGIVFYEMITGELPFKDGYEQAVFYSILNDDPRPMTGIRPGAPTELDEIVQKTLMKDPKERYQHMAELMSDIRAFQEPHGKRPAAKRAAGVKPFWRRRSVLLAGLFTLLVPVVYFIYTVVSSDPTGIESLAILPLLNMSGNGGQDHIADGVTDALIAELGQIRALRVISRTSVMQYKESKKTIQEIARELNVDALVEGTVLQEGNQIRISARLIQAAPERQIWSVDYTRELKNIIGLQEEVARNIAHEIRVSVTPEEQRRLAGARPVDPQAYKLYMTGYHYADLATREGVMKSIEYFSRALERDPEFSLAHVGLAEAYLWMGFRSGFSAEIQSRFEESVEKAIELDETNSETYRLIGMVKLYSRWDPLGAEEELKRAVELNPNSAPAHDLYSQALMMMGRMEESVAEREKTLQLDPLSHVYHCNGGFTYYWARMYEKAIEQAKMTSERFGPSCAFEDLVLGASYTQKGMFSHAISVLESRIEPSNENPRLFAELAYTYALAGKRKKAEEMLTQLNDRIAARHGHPNYYLSAVIQTALGRNKDAFQSLEKSLERQEIFFPYLKTDPRFDPIKQDPRFHELAGHLTF